jgi:CheY-like chemotaxis protein
MTPNRPVQIVVIEDNPADVELTLRALKAHRLANRVIVLRDGVEALDRLLPPAEAGPSAPFTPKVILLDLKLPKVDGLEVLRQLKTDQRTRAIPIVVMTSSNQEPDITACYHLGANSYVVKPVAFEAFALAVADIGMYWLLLNHPPR